VKSSMFFRDFTRYTSHAHSIVDAYCGKSFNKHHLSVALEGFALIVVWSAVTAMMLAVASFLLGEQ